MRQTSAELKRMAREQLRGHWGVIIGATALLYLILFAAQMPFYFFAVININSYSITPWIIYITASIIIGLAVSVLQAGLQSMYLNIGRKQEMNLCMMFMQFSKRPDRFIVGSLILAGISILCLVPGYVCMIVGILFEQFLALWISIPILIAGTVIYMILILKYALVQILLVDNSQMKVLDAYRESAYLMNGNKGRMFYIMLSFFGWIMLSMLSCGIGMLWIIPYMLQTTTEFYLDVKRDVNQEKIQEPEAESVIDEMV